MARLPEESHSRGVRQGAGLQVSRLRQEVQAQASLAVARQMHAQHYFVTGEGDEHADARERYSIDDDRDDGDRGDRSTDRSLVHTRYSRSDFLFCFFFFLREKSTLFLRQRVPRNIF